VNDRERFIETLLHGKPDRIPFTPGGARKSTLEAWHTQGLPEGVNYHDFLRQTLGMPPVPKPKAQAPQANFRMMPEFEEKVIERKQSSLVVQDWKGNICEISDRFDVTYLRNAIDFVTRRWIKCPVQSRRDWEEMKRRYNVDEPGRFEDGFEAKAAGIRQRDHVVGISCSGPWWQLREWCGFEGLCMMMIDQPALVRDMIAFWADFVSAVLERYLAALTPDHVVVNEDMAYKEKSMISPAMVREFLMPCWRQWTGQLRSAGVPVIDVDSDGFVGELIPLWIEAGFNANCPQEVAAGNDLPAYARRYGRAMGFHGGVDKRAIAKGGGVIRAELARLEPVVRAGGYIPGCDHGVPFDISWPNFVDYARLLARMTGWL